MINSVLNDLTQSKNDIASLAENI